MTRKHQPPRHARAGDWIELRSIDGRPARRGQITEVLGRGHHARYRVRWDERHQSIVYPGDDLLVIPKAQMLVTG